MSTRVFGGRLTRSKLLACIINNNYNNNLFFIKIALKYNYYNYYSTPIYFIIITGPITRVVIMIILCNILLFWVSNVQKRDYHITYLPFINYYTGVCCSSISRYC